MKTTLKLGIYLQNLNWNDNFDFYKLLELGNPGIGGTEYQKLLLINNLLNYTNKIEIILFLNKNCELQCKNQHIVDDEISAIRLFEGNNLIDIYLTNNQTSEVISRLNSLNVKTMLWHHNYIHSGTCDLIAKSNSIVSNIFVSKEMYDRYLDHDIIRKSTFIFNMVPNKQEKSNLIHKNVTYIGGLYPSKGFHKLALSWKKVIDKHPDAKLNVIGSSRLYGGSLDGDNTISNYEKHVKQIIIDNQLSDSVTFNGLLNAKEIETILKDTSVGVCNPTAKTETFCISGVEFSSYGIPVVTKGRNGIPDTVIHMKTGLHINMKNTLASQICKLLDDKTLRDYLGVNGLKHSANFSIKIALNKWINLITHLESNVKEESTPLFPIKNVFNNNKYLRLTIHFIRFKLKWKFIPSLIHLESGVSKFIKFLS
jgi:glycosyltransferase involved in cell wall biosynthesis